MKIASFFFLLIACCNVLQSQSISTIYLGKKIADFNLKNTDGTDVSLGQFADAKGFIIVFTCNHCPFAKLYTQRLNDLNKKYKPLGVPVLAINAMDSLEYDAETWAGMCDLAAAEKFNFPYLQDTEQCVAKNFGAAHTPQAFVVWRTGDDWMIRYSGCIDDNGEHPRKATPFVAQAVSDLLNNKPLRLAETQSFGCRIFYRTEDKVVDSK